MGENPSQDMSLLIPLMKNFYSLVLRFHFFKRSLPKRDDNFYKVAKPLEKFSDTIFHIIDDCEFEKLADAFLEFERVKSIVEPYLPPVDLKEYKDLFELITVYGNIIIAAHSDPNYKKITDMHISTFLEVENKMFIFLFKDDVDEVEYIRFVKDFYEEILNTVFEYEYVNDMNKQFGRVLMKMLTIPNREDLTNISKEVIEMFEDILDTKSVNIVRMKCLDEKILDLYVETDYSDESSSSSEESI